MPEDPKPQAHSNETLLDINAGVISVGGETLLHLDATRSIPA